MAAKKKASRKCKHGVNKRTKKCLKHPRKKAASKSRSRRARESMDWLTKGHKPSRVRRSGGLTIREYSPADSMKMIFG